MKQLPRRPKGRRLHHVLRPLRRDRLFRRKAVELPTPQRIPWPDAVTRMSIVGSSLIVEYEP